MRKDLRLGLGIGALATVFAVTFLVVRNHTQKQAAADPDAAQVAAGEAEGGAPEANVAVAAPGGMAGGTGVSAGGPAGGPVLPPLQPVASPDGRPPYPRIPAEDPFAKRQVRSGETPMPGPAGKPATGQGKPGDAIKPAGGGNEDWDLILATGRLETGSTVSRAAGLATPPPAPANYRAAANRGGESATVRPPQFGGTLSAATGRPYTVRDGDTFTSIAKAAYGSSKYSTQIERANRNVDPTRLQPGQQIVLPELSLEARATRATAGPFDRDDDNRPVNARTEYRVDTGDSLYRISTKLYGTPRMVNAIYEANRAAIGPNPERLKFGMILKLPRPAEQAAGR